MYGNNLNNKTSNVNEHIQINVLRDILLKDDRQSNEKLQALLNAHAEEMRQIEKRIMAQLEILKVNFPQTYSSAVNKLIAAKLQNSHREILDIIYPKLGLLIQKYIAHQIDLLPAKLKKQIEKLFKTKTKPRWWHKVLGSKINIPDLDFRDLQTSELKEIFIVQKKTGLLLGQASQSVTLKRELTAAMLTAVKSFMEDAFLNDTDELEQIRYGYYTLLLFNFPTYYYVLTFTGNLTATESHAYFEKACQFSELNSIIFSENIDDIAQIELSEKLKITFLSDSTVASENSFLEPINIQYHYD